MYNTSNITTNFSTRIGRRILRLPYFLKMARFTISIPDELNTWLEEQAALNHRSKHKQIKHILTMAQCIPIFSPEERYNLNSLALCHNGRHNFRSDNPATSDFCNCGMYTLGEIRG